MKHWVLIIYMLNNEPPAIVGGYDSQATCQRAGKFSIDGVTDEEIERRKKETEELWDKCKAEGTQAWPCGGISTKYMISRSSGPKNFQCIPGAAAQ